MEEKKISKAQLEERAKLWVCMEYIARQLNDEDIFESWLMCGVPDGDLEYGELDWQGVIDRWSLNDEQIEDLMYCFMACMYRAFKNDTGLYCAGVFGGGKSKIYNICRKEVE